MLLRYSLLLLLLVHLLHADDLFGTTSSKKRAIKNKKFSISQNKRKGNRSSLLPLLPHQRNASFFKATLDAKLLSSFQGVYRDRLGTPVFLRRGQDSLAVSSLWNHKKIDIVRIFQSCNLIDFSQNYAIQQFPKVKASRRRHSFHFDRSWREDVDTLLVYTTCNHVNMSIHSLQSISSAPDVFDIIVIDDHSIDGTTEILTKMGYSVISKPEARGLTDSWNIGYHIASLLKYRYIIFSNNDVLVPHGTVELVRTALKEEALVVPLTTQKGAGHNPTQSIEAHYDIDPRHIPLFNNPSNFQGVQDILSRLHNRTGKFFLRFLGA